MTSEPREAPSVGPSVAPPADPLGASFVSTVGAADQPAAGRPAAAAADGPGPTVAAVQRRIVAILIGTQMLGGVGVTIGITVGALLAADLAGTDTLAGLAATGAVVGAAVLARPISRLMDTRGRRPGMVLAYLTGAFGAALVVVASLVGSFVLALVGMVLFGGGSAANLQARYAATDLAPGARRALALSTVVWATTVGAVAGPNLAGPAGRLADGTGIPALAGPFLLSGVAFAVAAAVIAILLRPDPLLLARRSQAPSGAGKRQRSIRAALRTVRAHPPAALGLASVSVGHAVMAGLMTMAPLHMSHGGVSLTVIGVVISIHVAGMYALSPLVGWLSDRLGRRPVIGMGVGLLLAAAVGAGTADGHSSVRLGGALALLGLGWSCTLVAGSTLLTEAAPAAERPIVQGVTDLVMGLSGAGASLLAGLVVGLAGYPWLALIAGIAVLPLGVAALRRREHGRVPAG